MYRSLKITGIVIVVLVIICYSFFFIVSEGQNAIITQFGRPLEPITQPGLKAKLPYPIHRVVRFDARQQIFVSRLVEFLTADKKNILIRCYVTYNIDNPLTYYQSVGDPVTAQQKLDDLLIAQGGASVGDFNFDELFSVEVPIKINQLEDRIESDIRNIAESQYGIKIWNVGISRLALPDANAQSVYNRMTAERKARANKYRAEGQEEASKIQADANRQKSDITSAAYRDAQIIMGEGDAEAAKIYAEAFKRDPEFYQFWRTLETYTKILDNQTTLVLTEDSELFKYLNE